MTTQYIYICLIYGTMHFRIYLFILSLEYSIAVFEYLNTCGFLVPRVKIKYYWLARVEKINIITAFAVCTSQMLMQAFIRGKLLLSDIVYHEV